jgi:hypothetical protein
MENFPQPWALAEDDPVPRFFVAFFQQERVHGY